MIQYQFFPRSQGITAEIKSVIESFKAVEKEVDSSNKELKSNDVLGKFRTFLEQNGFTVENLLRYLLGRNDFYKVIAHTKDKTTEVKPFNMYGTLGSSTKVQKTQYKIATLKMPTQILSMAFKKDSMNTILIHCDNGWSLSLRIHNASEWVEPSLKFDIQLVGVPVNMGTQIESW